MNELKFLILFVAVFLTYKVQAINTIDSLKNITVSNISNDTEKIKALSKLIDHYANSDSLEFYLNELRLFAFIKGNDKTKKSASSKLAFYYYEKGIVDSTILYFENCLKIASKSEDISKQVSYLNNLGVIYSDKGNYKKAIEYFLESLKISEQINAKNIAASYNNIANIHSYQGNTQQTLLYLEKGIEAAKKQNDNGILGVLLDNKANALLKLNKRKEALTLYQQSLILKTQYSSDIEISNLFNNLGLFYLDDSQYDSAYYYLKKSLDIAEKGAYKVNIALSLDGIAKIEQAQKKYESSIKNASRALQLAQESEALIEAKDAAQTLYKSFAAIRNHKKELYYYKLFIDLRDSIRNEENQHNLLSQEYEYQYAKKTFADSIEYAKQQEIKNLEIASKNARIDYQRIILLAMAGVLLLLLALAYVIYKSKKQSDELLLNILPKETADELKANGFTVAKEYTNTSVLFTDFKDFTKIATQFSGAELVEEINICFKAFDKIIDNFNIEKIKTIGDAYMCVSGLPNPENSLTSDIVQAALSMQEFVENRKKERIAQALPFFEMRVGIHTGSVVAGIVGIKKFQYDIWGNTVNIAARMESNGEVGKVNISEVTYQNIKDKSIFSFINRGSIEVKGKGKMAMYFVTRY